MDADTSIILLIALSVISIVLVYTVSRHTLLKRRARAIKSVEDLSVEPTDQHDLHIVWENYIMGFDLAGATGISIMTCSFIVGFFADPAETDRGQMALLLAIAGIALIGTIFPILSIVLQRVSRASLLTVSEEGIDQMSYGSGIFRSETFMRWDQVAYVCLADELFNGSNVQLIVESDAERIVLRTSWNNFEYMAEKLLRLTPEGSIKRDAKDLLTLRAKNVKASASFSAPVVQRARVAADPAVIQHRITVLKWKVAVSMCLPGLFAALLVWEIATNQYPVSLLTLVEIVLFMGAMVALYGWSLYRQIVRSAGTSSQEEAKDTKPT
jgi:hypothetical protein